MLELTFLVISIDVKEKKYFSKIENFIKFYVGAHIFGDTLDHQGYFGQKLRIGALIFSHLRFLGILGIWKSRAFGNVRH